MDVQKSAVSIGECTSRLSFDPVDDRLIRKWTSVRQKSFTNCLQQ